MYLKSIELQGFKSFANKINFEFHDGITAIVGPNGSGKSNVADAVRWVLGEQSSKQLRGSNMQDVIFSGTQNRKPQGYAYAALTLDNSDHSLAIDYDEVTVGRRVYRSGESEYTLNGTPCRLKDVYELFYDTGIGKEGYSIIGQGQIDKILSGKPEDRRELFDETAGIVKYKKRKAAAQKKLENEQVNLNRVSDILGELEKQFGPLERQSEKAKEYLKLKEELKKYDINGYLLESSQIKDKLTASGKDSEIVGGHLDELSVQSESLRNQYEELEKELSELENRINSDKEKANNLGIQSENLNGQIKVTYEQINTEKAGIAHIQSRLSDIEKEINARIAEKEGISASKGEINIQLDETDDRITQLEEVIEKENAVIAELTKSVTEIKESFYQAMSEKAGLDAKMQHFEDLKEQNQTRKQELAQKLQRFKEETDQQKKLMLTLSQEKDRISSEFTLLKAREKELNEKIQRSRSDSEKTAALCDAKKNEYNSCSTRLESLRNIAERYEGYGNSVRKVMESRSQFPGIIGVVADLIEVPSEYETAIETALGGTIQNIVTDNEQTAKKAIGFLKANKYGRATFLPLTGINSRGEFSKSQVLSEKGVIGLADSLVKIKGGNNELLKYLLGKTVVADNIDNAILLSRKYQQTLKIVTLEGELFNPGGAVSGGAYRNNSNLLGRKRELEELESSKNKAFEELKSLEESRKNIRQETESLMASLNETRTALQNNKINENKNSIQSLAAKQRNDELKNQKEDIEKENALIKQQLITIEQSKGDIKDSAKLVTGRSKDAQKELTKLEKKLAAEIEKKEKHALELENLKLEFSNLSQRDSFILENMDRVDREKEKLEEEKSELKENIKAAEDRINEKDSHISEIRQQIKVSEAETEKLNDTLGKLIKSRDEKMSVQKGYFDKKEEISAQISSLEKEKFRLESIIEKLTEQLDKYAEYLWSEYEMTPSEAAGYEIKLGISLTEIKKQISQLKQSIKNLGPVNVNSIEDFKDVSERYFFMKAQHEDLIKAQESLIKIIGELDEGMRKQFKEKFADIQAEFDRVFKELFGGGKGTLELMEDEDVLEAGIQIIAQPPGKKLQNMMQLSGGEKALTAISLLFAIQNLKPSPFCLLDEIEAALDDSNVTRYAEYLAKLKQNTQFIVITHRRGTMAIADRLYGITMQEKGVSTLVSVDLTDEKFLQEK